MQDDDDVFILIFIVDCLESSIDQGCNSHDLIKVPLAERVDISGRPSLIATIIHGQVKFEFKVCLRHHQRSKKSALDARSSHNTNLICPYIKLIKFTHTHTQIHGPAFKSRDQLMPINILIYFFFFFVEKRFVSILKTLHEWP